MGKKKKRISFQHTGLEIATLFGRYFLNTEDLHYGYWTDDIQVTPANLKKAQEKYTDLIIETIPDEVETILDAGAGNGNLSKKLKDRGFKVESLTPSKFQANVINSKLDHENQVHISKFEHCKTLRKYDLIIFSESFQYIPMKKALDKIKESLNPNGKVIICDFFSLGNKRDKIFKGGHKWTRFEEIFLDGEFTIRSNVDITEATSPNVALFANLINEVGFPTGSLLREYLEYKFPRLTKFLLWKFRDSLDDISTKYDHQTLNIENFLNSKTYRLILLSI